ncbi:GTP-binding protein [Oceanobacillus piezotolerans]|uniref:GTP-binding protein n=1 Tax=Oceanobacillus piezotolerans TaxID=2448030 RepID=A0A498DMT1_9BACI|nr:putative glycoside hydrolase [Oceanobacillus piezotolerans]RLL45062.1 GTP-binding protein [Oceanobacillus piezotolerans]
MGKKQLGTTIILATLLIIGLALFIQADELFEVQDHSQRETKIEKIEPNQSEARFLGKSEYHFEYPDAVRGIYVTGNAAGTSKFDTLVDFVDSTALNAMVIDVKDDFGNLTFMPEQGSDFEEVGTNMIQDPDEMMKTLEEKQIYPIARVVVFKDSELAKRHPEYSFTEDGEVWVNNRGEAFVNPFVKEVWEYNVEIAKMAAEMGFQEIQFDYVRFPEGFETKDEIFEYTMGDYQDLEMNNVKKRVEAVSDFVAYAKEELKDYNVDVSVDIFGYAATIEETPGIGQNFSRISENVDIISSMVYPSHWSNGYFGIEMPDKEPYRLISEYAKVENEVLGALESPPVSRPWLQDFEAPWIYDGPATEYDKEEIEAQIKALYDNGIYEFLLWNAGSNYSKNVDYLFGLSK